MGTPEPDGISILIPVYNYSILELATELSGQAALLGLAYEIICYDDASEMHWKVENRWLKSNRSIIYKELSQNIGRSKIRNLMASAASYPHLIFLDCDSRLPANDFLKKYWESRCHPVIVGGRIYTHEAPVDSRFLLHWSVGRAREQQFAAIRRMEPYKSFMFNNVFIYKSVFTNILLDESIKTYGHEDTKFGYLLQAGNIPVFHIDNPALHVGLDETEAFLLKTQQGVANLYRLTKEGYGLETKLFKYFKRLRLFKAEGLFLFAYKKFLQKRVERNLRSSHPSLFYFDLCKLAAFIEVGK
jgi:glycosyltransferase involved in cell wall biosynthesis